MAPNNHPAWSFQDVPEARSDRPRLSRHSSLPRALYAPDTGSIFGAGATVDTVLRPAASSDHERVHRNLNVSSNGPLSTFPGTLESDRFSHVGNNIPTDDNILPRAEKDADDPTSAPPSSSRGMQRQDMTTITTLSRLFAVHGEESPMATPMASHQPPGPARPRESSMHYTRSGHSTETAALPDHLYSRGLLSGRHSDITINAFGHQYKLHRLILDRAPFFSSALSEPWLESSAKEMTVKPEDIDNSITQASFELALKRLYGCSNLVEEDEDPAGLFATGCWLEMQDLVDTAIESMLRQMTPETLSPLIRLVTSNYYGRSGDKILASAKSMLCRDGWKMPVRYWDGIPGDIVREIIGGDGFFIDGEWDRWVLAKRILDRRLKVQAAAEGLVEPGTRRKVLRAPDASHLNAVRFDSVYRGRGIASGQGLPSGLSKWISCYTHPEVEPMLVLLDEGVHYVHLDFEQLQYIRQAKDCFGLPVMSEKVISNALWQQMELRQRVVNARDSDLEIGLSVQCADDSTLDAKRDTTMSITTPTEPNKGKGKSKATRPTEADDYIDSGSWDGNGKPRKFWIPTSDCNIVMGGNADPIIATSNNTTLQRHAGRMSNTIQPEDIQWAADFSAATSALSQPRPPPGDGMPSPISVSYTHFPPFRFAAEFPNPRMLKEKKRVYSRTVFYAGSLWNIYIQKVASSRSKQLGVYLHRAKERETEETIGGTAGLAQGSVGERINAVERGSHAQRVRDRRRLRREANHFEDQDVDDGESSGSAGDHDSSLLNAFNDGSSSAHTMRNILSRPHRKSSQQDAAHSVTAMTSDNSSGSHAVMTPDTDSSDNDSATEQWSSMSRNSHVPALPPYVDARPTIRTYFKIYSPSRGGRMLSVYESAPDKFNFSQSWGWKSSTLMLDEGLLGGDEEEGKDDGFDHGSGENEDGCNRRITKGKGDGKLRFMVVVGNI